MEFGLSTIGQIAITVSQVDQAIAFYRDKLGMKFLFQVAETSGENYSSILYFKVADIQQAQHELSARGVTFEREPAMIARMPDHDLWMTFFRDLDRNLLALMSEVPHSGAAVTG
jgi:methylmalonyl-CoA/ethylmalonyl-CoA epimerase